MQNLILRKYQMFRKLPFSLRSLIINSAIVAFGSFMITPFLAIFLQDFLHQDAKTIGVCVAFSTLVQFGGGILGAMVAERMGLKRTMVFALGFRAIGFVFLALAPLFMILMWPAVFIIAAGSALYLPANRAYIVSSVAEDLKPFFLSISNAVLSIGMAIGPIVAAFLIGKNISFLLYISTALFVALSVFHQFSMSEEINKPKRTSFSGLPEALYNARGPLFFGIITYYLYFFFQSYIGLYVSKTYGASNFGWIMLVNLLTLAIIQPFFASKIVDQRFNRLLSKGYFIMACGFLLFSLNHFALVMVGTIVMSVGQALVVLRSDVEIIRRLPQSTALAFGIQRLAVGLGGMIAGLIGGLAYSYYQSASILNVMWIFVAVNCLFAAVLALRFEKIQELIARFRLATVRQ